jgi:hypothetical protein
MWSIFERKNRACGVIEILLGSPFKFLYFLVVGLENSGAYMFLIDIPFKGCQGHSNRSLIVHGVSYLHAVSMKPHAFLIFLHTIAVLHMIFTFRRCYTNFLYMLSLIPHARCMRYQWYHMHTCMRGQWHRMHRAYFINDTACTMHAVSMTPHAF